MDGPHGLPSVTSCSIPAKLLRHRALTDKFPIGTPVSLSGASLFLFLFCHGAGPGMRCIPCQEDSSKERKILDTAGVRASLVISTHLTPLRQFPLHPVHRFPIPRQIHLDVPYGAAYSGCVPKPQRLRDLRASVPISAPTYVRGHSLPAAAAAVTAGPVLRPRTQLLQRHLHDSLQRRTNPKTVQYRHSPVHATVSQQILDPVYKPL